MKKLLRNFEFTAPVVASFLVVALTGVTVFAGPGGMPPGGNVDANFNSISAGTGAPAGMGIGGDFKGDKNGVKAVAKDLVGTVGGDFKGSSGIKAVATDAGSGIGGDFQGSTGVKGTSNGGAGLGGDFKGTLYGAKGTATGGGMSAGGEFEGGQFGVEAKATGLAGIGGSFTAKGAGVVAHAKDGYGGEFHSENSGGGLFDGAGYGVEATASAPGSTGASAKGQSYGLVAENLTPGMGSAGYFKGTAMGVQATTSDAAGKGGQFYGPGMGISAVTEAGGIGGYFMNKKMGGLAELATDNDAFNVGGLGFEQMKIDYNGNLSTNGHLKAAAGIGNIYFKNGGWLLLQANKKDTVYLVSCNSNNDRALAVGYNGGGATENNLGSTSFPTPSSAGFFIESRSAMDEWVNPWITCWDPNGNW